MEISLLYDIGIIIAAAALCALLARMIKQPLILGYVLAGVIIGKPVLKLVVNETIVSTLSELGIAFLLFIIGVEFDVRKVRSMGVSIVIMGAVQVILTFAAGLLAAKLLGLPTMESIYIGLILAFSSTMIVVKLLNDANELDSIHGRIALGILILQDVFAVLALTLLGSKSTDFGGVVLVLGKGLLLIGFAYLAAKYIFPKLLRSVIKNPELILVAAISICFVFAGISFFLGYSLAIGAFIAGITLGATEFNHEVSGRVKPLRDFFAVLFFVSLGMSLVIESPLTLLSPLLIFFAIVVLIKPIIIFGIVKAFKYGSRTAFFSATSLAQVSEFSLILAAQGANSGIISQSTLTITTILTISSIILTAYIMKYDELIYARFSAKFRTAKNNKENWGVRPAELKGHTIIFGTYRTGIKVIDALQELKTKFVVVDHNPERIRELRRKKIHFVCSDMTNYELPELLKYDKVHMFISTVHNYDANMALLEEIKKQNKKAIKIFTTRSMNEAMELYEEGADYVVVPESLGGEKISNYLKHLDDKGIQKWGRMHYKTLKHELRKGVSKYGRY